MAIAESVKTKSLNIRDRTREYRELVESDKAARRHLKSAKAASIRLRDRLADGSGTQAAWRLVADERAQRELRTLARELQAISKRIEKKQARRRRRRAVSLTLPAVGAAATAAVVARKLRGRRSMIDSAAGKPAHGAAKSTQVTKPLRAGLPAEPSDRAPSRTTQ